MANQINNENEDKLSDSQLNDNITKYYTSEFFESILDNLSLNVFVKDKSGKLIYCNQSTAKTLNKNKNELINKTDKDLFPSEVAKKLQKDDDYVRSSNSEIEFVENVIINGKSKSLKAVKKNLLTKNPSETKLLGYSFDITQQKVSENLLKDQESKYRTIFNSINDVVFIHNVDTLKILDANDKAFEMYQYTREELLNQTIEKISENITPYNISTAFEYVSKSLEGEAQIFNWHARRKDNSLFWVEVSMKVSFIDNDKRIIVVIRDITERVAENEIKKDLFNKLEEKAVQLSNLNSELKVSEEKLLRLNANRDKFYSTITHDLKSPFLSILGYTEFLDSNLELLSYSELRDSLNSLTSSITNVYSLIERLLEWSRTQTGEFYFHPTDIKLAKIFDNNIELLLKNIRVKNIKLLNKIDPDEEVFADENMLSSIIRNLVSNAIKFTERNGEIVISSLSAKDYTTISVKDNGVGIDSDTLSKLFSISNQTSSRGTENEPGTGLGLLLCKEWIEKNNGKIWVESIKNIGTTFLFTLPISKKS